MPPTLLKGFMSVFGRLSAIVFYHILLIETASLSCLVFLSVPSMLPSTGAILKRGLAFYRANYKTLFWYLVPLFCLVLIQGLFLSRKTAEGSVEPVNIWLLLLGFMLFVIVSAFQIALVRVIGKLQANIVPNAVQEEIKESLPLIIPYILVTGIASIATGIALVFFIVPGFILGTLWMFAAYSVILDNKSISQSFGMSRSLVQGKFWPLIWRTIGLSMAVIIPFVLLLLVVSPLLSLFDAHIQEFIGSLLGNVLLTFVVGPLFAIFFVMLYLESKADRAPYNEQPKTKDQLASLTLMWPVCSLFLAMAFFALTAGLLVALNEGSPDSAAISESGIENAFVSFSPLLGIHMLVVLAAIALSWIAYAAKKYTLARWISLAPVVTLILYYGQIILFRIPSLITG